MPPWCVWGVYPGYMPPWCIWWVYPVICLPGVYGGVSLLCICLPVYRVGYPLLCTCLPVCIGVYLPVYMPPCVYKVGNSAQRGLPASLGWDNSAQRGLPASWFIPVSLLADSYCSHPPVSLLG